MTNISDENAHRSITSVNVNVILKVELSPDLDLVKYSSGVYSVQILNKSLFSSTNSIAIYKNVIKYFGGLECTPQGVLIKLYEYLD